MTQKSKRKAPVVALRGSFKDEIVTQDALAELASAQRAEWMVCKRASLLSEAVKHALARGAKIEDGALYFDEKLEMVRSRKREDAG